MSFARPSGNIDKREVYNSKKHKMCRFKTEMSVISNTTVTGLTDHYPGSKANVDIS